MAIVETVDALVGVLKKGQRMMALDLGSKTIGMACGDTRHHIATAFDTISRKKFTADAAQLEAILAAENIGGLVVGLPLNMNGTEGARVQATRAFISNLQSRATFPPMPILLWDERLTSVAAERVLLSTDMSRAKRAKHIDKLAAAYLLQGVLDNWQNHSKLKAS